MENKKYILKKTVSNGSNFFPRTSATSPNTQFVPIHVSHAHTAVVLVFRCPFLFPLLASVFAPARPQPTSRPLVPQKHVQARQVLLSWEPGSDGLSPVRYYTVQLRELPESNWTVHSASVSHEATTYIVSR